MVRLPETLDFSEILDNVWYFDIVAFSNENRIIHDNLDLFFSCLITAESYKKTDASILILHACTVHIHTLEIDMNQRDSSKKGSAKYLFGKCSKKTFKPKWKLQVFIVQLQVFENCSPSSMVFLVTTASFWELLSIVYGISSESCSSK